MIEEVRRANIEKTVDLDRHLQNNDDTIIYKRFADELHQTLIRTRKMLQFLFDFLDSVPHEDKVMQEKKFSSSYKAAREQSRGDLVSFFIGMQRATSGIVKGGFHLSHQNVVPSPSAESILQTMDNIMEEGKRLVVYCESQGIPPFDSDFLRKILTTTGLDGFKKLVEDERFAVLRIKSEFFREAVLHQQGDPVAFLEGKVKFVNEKVEELKSSGEFDELAKDHPHIFAEAVFEYRTVKRGFNQHPFSNPYDYLVRRKKNYEREKAKAAHKKPRARKRVAEDLY